MWLVAGESGDSLSIGPDIERLVELNCGIIFHAMVRAPNQLASLLFCCCLWCVNGVWMGSKIAAVVGLCRLVLSVCRSVWTVFFGFAEFAG